MTTIPGKIVDENLQVRKLQHCHTSALARILDPFEGWKNLMKIIPSTLRRDTYKCDLGIHNLPKYKSEHFSLLESAAQTSKRSCTAILLDEWGTSGRVLPTVGHLKYLLEKAELLRAADYVSIDILGRGPVERPTNGPTARVALKPEEDPDLELVRKLEQMPYPSTAIEDNQNPQIDTNNMNLDVKPLKAPEIYINYPSDDAKGVKQLAKTEQVSDLIKFSSSSPQNTNDDNISYISGNSANVPEISLLVNNIPDLLNLQASESYSLPTEVQDEAFNIPQVSQLLGTPNQDENSKKTRESSPSSRRSFQTISRSASSRLPELVLQTDLPHFSYSRLQNATRNFDETPLNHGGHFLGQGNFGKVFLAVDLFEKPIAVKQLRLENPELVREDDCVTKQFRNEVEILTQYKHENLLSLLGYSCDGDTYCLLYEYIPGGSLNERLTQKSPHQILTWRERLKIAYGTASAVAYLHTAFVTPLIHRDIKSGNILLDHGNIAKLCDFGLIKMNTTAATMQATTISGTGPYMAPEATRGDISMKVDTFSFGVVLLELLTSLPPYDKDRESCDLVTFMFSIDEIGELLDTSAGDWIYEGKNIGDEIYDLAQSCIDYNKNRRPTMVQVCDKLKEIAGAW